MKTPPTVLIVEDHVDSALMLKCFLYYVGLRAVCAQNVSTAILVAKWQRPAIALVDLSLPNFNQACDLVQRLAASERAPYIVGLNGYGFMSYETLALGAGCNAVLRKPFDLQQMLMTIREALDTDQREASPRTA